jgi:hypothetical protein
VGDAVHELRKSRGLGRDLGAIGGQRGDLRVGTLDAGLKLLGAGFIDFVNDVAQDYVARKIVWRIAGAAVGITALLAPAVFRGDQAVMAGKAIELGVFGPDAVLRFSRDAQQIFPELNGLSDG